MNYNPRRSYRFVLLLSCCFVLAFANAAAQSRQQAKQKYTPPDTALYGEIALQDSMMFAAFNEHNTAKLMSFFSPGLEFYHDKGGLTGYEQTAKNFETLFENNKTTGMRRDLVKGSLEVYPIKDFGAVETCLHRFCHTENGKADCGTFKNIMVCMAKDRRGMESSACDQLRSLTHHRSAGIFINAVAVQSF